MTTKKYSDTLLKRKLAEAGVNFRPKGTPYHSDDLGMRNKSVEAEVFQIAIWKRKLK